MTVTGPALGWYMVIRRETSVVLSPFHRRGSKGTIIAQAVGAESWVDLRLA